MVERGQRHLRNPDQACQFLELGLNCTQEINDKCVQDAIFADRILLPSPISSIIRGYKTKEYFDNPCFDQRFDEFFNQDGMCSFQDIKEYVLLNFFFTKFTHPFLLELLSVFGTKEFVITSFWTEDTILMHVGLQKKLKIASRKRTSTVWDSFINKSQTLVILST